MDGRLHFLTPIDETSVENAGFRCFKSGGQADLAAICTLVGTNFI